MAINDRDFYASHGISFDIAEMQIEYTKRVIKQAKIEVLTELKTKIERLEQPTMDEEGYTLCQSECLEIIQEKIDKLRGDNE